MSVRCLELVGDVTTTPPVGHDFLRPVHREILQPERRHPFTTINDQLQIQKGSVQPKPPRPASEVPGRLSTGIPLHSAMGSSRQPMAFNMLATALGRISSSALNAQVCSVAQTRAINKACCVIRTRQLTPILFPPRFSSPPEAWITRRPGAARFSTHERPFRFDPWSTPGTWARR